MLRTGPYPAFLKRRIASPKGHLSNHDACCVLRTLSDSLHLAVLAHLSEENNTPDLALRQAQESLSFHADHVELFAASSVEGEECYPVRKEPQKCRERCTDKCWQYSFEL